MLFRGEAIVPPGCPAVSAGGADLGTAPVNVYIHEAKSEGSEVTEAFIGFGHSDDGGAVLTDSLIVPFGTEVSDRANDLKDRHEANPETVEEAIRAAFTERVATCPGLQNGVCGALGAEVVTAVINQLSD